MYNWYTSQRFVNVWEPSLYDLIPLNKMSDFREVLNGFAISVFSGFKSSKSTYILISLYTIVRTFEQQMH